jgi:hypothetical protein
MRHCYRCRAEITEGGARRELQTGSSRRSSWSSRGSSRGSTVRRGVRTVCESCAASIDRWNAIKMILIGAVVAAVLAFVIVANMKK